MSTADKESKNLYQKSEPIPWTDEVLAVKKRIEDALGNRYLHHTIESKAFSNQCN